MVNEAKKTNKDSYAVWGEPEIALEKNTIMDLIRSKDIHTNVFSFPFSSFL